MSFHKHQHRPVGCATCESGDGGQYDTLRGFGEGEPPKGAGAVRVGLFLLAGWMGLKLLGQTLKDTSTHHGRPLT